MKRFLIFIFIVLFLPGCSNRSVNLKTNEGIATSSINEQSHKEYVVSPPAKNQFFINPDEGWKATYKFTGMYNEDMILYKTKDGGKTWSEIANSNVKGSTLPNGTKSGMFFINTNKGWITANDPSSGNIGLFVTLDGGVTWNKQSLQVPDKFKCSMIESFPPLFFSNSDGILLVFSYVNNNRDFIFYVTHNGGDSWTVNDKDKGVSNEIKWNLKRGNPGSYEITYRKSIWNFEGDTWVKKSK